MARKKEAEYTEEGAEESFKHHVAEANNHMNKATDGALQIVENKARKIMNKHKDIKEFVMGMGMASFTDKRGRTIFVSSPIETDKDADKRVQDLQEFIGDWDDELHLTGNPMRFTANGKKRTDW